jgi:L-threonylcarbamoyladenylate synthase
LKPWHISKAVEVISHGGVIAYPTEAVYGLGCSAYVKQAVEKILWIKSRRRYKGLILVGYEIEDFRDWIDLDFVKDSHEITGSWPGPVTWIIPAKRNTPSWLSGGNPGIAVRISAHPIVRSLTEKAGILVSTSANPASRMPARTSLGVHNYFGKSIDYIIPGDTGSTAKPTEIRDALTGRVIRKA